MAWEWIPGPGDDGEMIRPFECIEHCMKGNHWHDGARESRGCTHPDLPPVEWDPPDRRAKLHSVHLGRSPEVDRKDEKKPWQGPDWWKHPPEPVEDGCPAGWMISPFGLSIRPYMRRRTDHGGRVPNPRFDALRDRVAQAAVLEFEDHQERLIAHRFRELTKKRHKHGSGNT